MSMLYELNDPMFGNWGRPVEAVLEDSGNGGQPTAKLPVYPTFESADAVSEFAQQQIRSQAMSALLVWWEEEECTFSALDQLIMGIADLDEDMEVSGDNEEALYNEIWQCIPAALAALGVGSKADIEAMINEEDDAAAARIGKELTVALDANEADDDELVVGFALGSAAVLESCDDAERHMVLEAAYRRKKVVRDGEVTTVNKRVSGKVKLSPKQKMSLFKANKKSHSSAANMNRRRSMKARRRRGM